MSSITSGQGTPPRFHSITASMLDLLSGQASRPLRSNSAQPVNRQISKTQAPRSSGQSFATVWRAPSSPSGDRGVVKERGFGGKPLEEGEEPVTSPVASLVTSLVTFCDASRARFRAMRTADADFTGSSAMMSATTRNCSAESPASKSFINWAGERFTFTQPPPPSAHTQGDWPRPGRATWLG